jgi:signal peptidase
LYNTLKRINIGQFNFKNAKFILECIKKQLILKNESEGSTMVNSTSGESKSFGRHKVFTVIGIVLCIILIPMLIINCTLIIKSYTNSDKVPSIGGAMPLIVMSDSMYPLIEKGDLIICHSEDPENIKVGDIIAFFDPEGNGTSVVTHRVIEITTEDNDLAFRTQGDANNTEDKALVPAGKLVGVFQSDSIGAGTVFSGMGNVALFMQSTTGLIVCVIVPIALLVGYDILRRKIYDKNKKKDTDALLAELEELRSSKAQTEAVE